MTSEALDHDTLISLTADIVSAHVSHNTVAPTDVPALIGSIFAALRAAGGQNMQREEPVPAVSVRASVKKDHIVCLDCGKKMKMLKRHISTEHGMTTDEYRQRWDLPPDYPLVAPNYAETRRDLAKKIGLGKKPGARRGRRKK